jgi:HlyD family secretion protein
MQLKQSVIWRKNLTESNNKKKKGKKGLWLLAVILVLAALFVGWRILNNQREASQVFANLQTEPYRRDSLNAFIYGTGTVQPSQTAVLTWSTSGIVGEVNIALGDTVEKDAVLIALDPDSLSVDILQAKIDVINAQTALDDLYENWGADLARARLDLLNAEEDLDDLENTRARMNSRRCSDERIEEYEEDLEDAKELYDLRETAENRRLVDTAQANLDFCLSDFTEREIAEAELELELGEAKVAQLQNRVAVLTSGPDPDEVTILETRLAIAQSRLDSPYIKAPFAGVITALPTQTGDVVQIGTRAVQLDNLADLHLDVQISEIDIPQVRVGQPAQLVFDAYFESTFNGEITDISPVGTSVQGVVEYSVTVSMLDADMRIRPGMTAAVTILVEEIDEVFVIPNDAIVSSNGQDVVYVRRGGDYEAVPVTLGSYSDFYSEVIEADIREGELIVLNPPAEITGAMPFGGPPGGGGFGGGFGN